MSIRSRSFLNRSTHVLRTALSRLIRYPRIASVLGGKAAFDVVRRDDRPRISIENLDDKRYYVYLLIALTREWSVGCSPRDIVNRAWAWLPRQEFLQTTRVNWRASSDDILLTETRHGAGVIHVSRQYYSAPPAENRVFMPYFAHPEYYKAGLHEIVQKLRGRARKVRIFFAGTVVDSSYSEHFKFPLLTRGEILGRVTSRFAPDITTDAAAPGPKRILIVSTSDTRDVVSKHKFSIADYIDALSRSDFFICPPGWLMPHSHNLIEAMSVGTIPITNYPMYMRPPLTPNLNCLAFSTLDELEVVISRALNMQPEEIAALREGVISYYDEYLDPVSFGRKLMNVKSTVTEIVVNDETGG